MNNSDRNSGEELMNAYYRLIGEAHIDNIIEDLDGHKNEIEALEVPESLEDWFQEFTLERKKTKKRQERRLKQRQFTYRAASVIAVMIMALSLLTVTVDAFRVRVFNMFLETRPTHTSITFDEATGFIGDQIPVEVGAYFPAYVPDGFSVKEVVQHNVFQLIEFTHEEEKSLSFHVSSLNGGMTIDTEDALVSNPMVQGSEAIMSQKLGNVILVWHNDTNAFSIIGEISEQDALKMAESVQKK